MNTKALYTISYGLYIIGSRKGERLNGQTANTVIQVSSEPPTISVCINKGNLTHEFIKDSGAFTVSILSQDTPLSFIGNFGFKSGRDIDKFDGINYKIGETQAPIVLDNTLAYLEAKEIKEARTKAVRYKCTVCGYVYDPEKGDPESGIAPGTPFKKLPEDWICA